LVCLGLYGFVLVCMGLSWFVWVWFGLVSDHIRLDRGKRAQRCLPTYPTLPKHACRYPHARIHLTLPYPPTHLDALATSLHAATQPSDTYLAPHHTTQHIPTPTSPYYPILYYTIPHHTSLYDPVSHPPTSFYLRFLSCFLFPFHSLSPRFAHTLRQPPAPPPTTDGGPLRCAHAPSA
jgi:hypothetical protein